MNSSEEENSSSTLLTGFKPLSYTAVRQEVATFQAVSAENTDEWQREVSMYEETFYDLDTSTSQIVEMPRRNYPNDACKVKDTELYPYHNACYPLIEAYTQTAREPDPLEARMPGHLPCSDASIISTISGLSHQPPFRLTPALQDEWNNGLQRRLKAANDSDFRRRPEKVDSEFASINPYGLAHFPVNDGERRDILLKLLRHSMSDLQNDHRLAGEVILRMSRWNLFQDAGYLRRVLCIVESGLKECNGRCFDFIWDQDGEEFDDDELPDHSCRDWSSFINKLSFMISNGIEYFSAEHALITATVLQRYFDNANPAAAEIEASVIEEAINPKLNQSTKDKRRTLLKQKIFLSNNTYFGYEDEEEDSEEDEEEEMEMPETYQTNWCDDIITGLGGHAILARRRIVELRDLICQNGTNKEQLVHELRRSIDAFYNCTRCLVYIGEAALRRLPNNPHVVGFCSRLVLCMTRLFVEPNIDTCLDATDYRTYLKAGRSLIDPNRYADSILSATKNYRQRHFPASRHPERCNADVKAVMDEADHFLASFPPKDVQDLIWCLFTKDLVDPMVSRCGWGDIQVWWGLPITPLDPLLFFDDCNSPLDSVIEDAWDQNIEEPIPWETDEVGKELWGDRLNARYDFSLVLLLCAWHAPWNVDSHHSFQTPFREAVTTLFLCANRINMPADIAACVCSYLRRDWWSDERAQCFSEDCLERRATKLLHQKLISQVTGAKSKQPGDKKSRRLCTSCPGCHVASYCCDEHKRDDYRDGHKGLCRKPPYRIPGVKEQELLNDVLCHQQSESKLRVLNEHVMRLIESQLHRSMDAVDDASGSSWESVDSEEDFEDEASESLTDIVHAYFEKECYGIQRSEDEEEE